MNQKNIYISHELRDRGSTKASGYVVQSKSKATNKSSYLANLMDEISSTDNLRLAFKAVKHNKGPSQGEPLSPLLSNILLYDLDRELEKHGHSFCRYADDCNIYVKSKAASKRVMTNITKFIKNRLKLTVNKDKSAVSKMKH